MPTAEAPPAAPASVTEIVPILPAVALVMPTAVVVVNVLSRMPMRSTPVDFGAALRLTEMLPIDAAVMCTLSSPIVS